MKFSDLRAANVTRQLEWPGSDQADIAFRGLEVAGEFGEVAEALKKYLREERGIKGSTASLDDVASEMADAIIALDLLADQMGVDLGAAVARKFNATSEKYGLATRLETGQSAVADGLAEKPVNGNGSNGSSHTETPSVAERLRELKMRSGLTLKQLAGRMGKASSSSIQRYFSASYKNNHLPIKIAHQFAHALEGEGAPPIKKAEVISLAAEGFKGSGKNKA